MTSQPLRILVTVDPVLPVPPVGYGGTHRIAAAVVRGLVERGHRVTVVAAPGSRLPGARVLTQRYRYPAPVVMRLWWFLVFAVRVGVHARRCDVLVSFWREDFLRWVLPPQLPVVLTHHDPIIAVETDPTSRTVRVSVSDDQRSGLRDGRWRTIRNGVDVDFLTPDPDRRGGYVAFLGRLSPEKGVDTAVRVCLRAGVSLRIGGNLPSDASSQDLFDREVQPWIGHGVEWLGELDDAGKRSLLQGADALLFPIRWREPFGMVMAEALACGTPVVALRAGSTSEVVQHGTTGFLCDDENGLIDALRQAASLDRSRCREAAIERYSEERMVREYLRLIDGLVKSSA